MNKEKPTFEERVEIKLRRHFGVFLEKNMSSDHTQKDYLRELNLIVNKLCKTAENIGSQKYKHRHKNE